MFSLGSISASLGIETGGYTSGILNANAVTQVFGQTFTTFVTNPVLGGIQVMKKFGQSAIKSATDVLGLAESLQRLSDQTGLAVETIQALREQNVLAGSSAEIAERATRNFATRLGQAAQGSQELVRALQDVGVNANNITSVDDAFRKAISTISQMTDAQDRAAISAKLFGEEAGPLIIRAVRDAGGDIDKLISKFTKLGLVIDTKAVSSLAGLNTTLGLAEQGFEGIKRTAIVQFLQAFVDQVGTADESIVDLVTNIIQRLGPAAHDLGDNIGEIVGDLDTLIDRIDSIVDRSDKIAKVARLILDVSTFGVSANRDADFNPASISDGSEPLTFSQQFNTTLLSRIFGRAGQ